MVEPRILQGDLNAGGARVAIAMATFNAYIVDSLLSGALGALERCGVPPTTVTVCKVPGAFELPPLINRLAGSGDYDGIVALGTIIRGATPHFDYVAGECVRGVSAVAREHGVPVGFGILTVDTIEQAIERAGTKAGNKGEEATLAVIEMVNTLRRVE